MMTDPISHTQGYWVWLGNKPNSIRFNSYAGSKDIGSGSATKLETLKIMLHIFFIFEIKIVIDLLRCASQYASYTYKDSF